MKGQRTTLAFKTPTNRLWALGHTATMPRGSTTKGTDTARNVMSNTSFVQAIDIINLYSVHSQTIQPTYQPFIQSMSLIDSENPECTFHALIDDGALANAMSKALYQCIKNHISGWHPSKQHLHMADGTIVPSLATW